MNTASQAGSDRTPSSSHAPAQSPVFATTRWTVVVTAGGVESPQSQVALERLCQTYWYPLYAYVRRQGRSPEDAQDLTQEFFARLLAGNWVERADPNRGKFRSFLLTVMNRFLIDEWDKARAQKRGGGVRLLPLQFETAETRYGLDPADRTTPEQVFERRWAMALLEEVLRRLRNEYKVDGKEETFAALNSCLVGERADQPYAELAVKLGTSEGTIKSAVHRMRQRYRQLLREEIAHTVTTPDEVNEELRHLFSVLGK